MKKLKALFAGSVLLAFTYMGCQPKPMDEATMMKKADSSFMAQKQSVDDEVMKDCDANKAAWVQMKADSIYKADSAAMAMSKK